MQDIKTHLKVTTTPPIEWTKIGFEIIPEKFYFSFLSPNYIPVAGFQCIVPECSKYFFWWMNTNMNIIRKRHIIWIQIWILIWTPWVTNMNKNIIRNKYSQIYANIQIYLNIKKIIKSKVTTTYQSEDCGYDIKTFS